MGDKESDVKKQHEMVSNSELVSKLMGKIASD